MGQKVLGKFVTFLVALIITVGLVAVLSMASRVTPEEAADRYIQQAQSQQTEPERLSVPVIEGPGISMISSTAGFLALAAIPVIGLLVYARSSRKAAKSKNARTSARAHRQSYKPRKDMSWQGALGEKYRV